MALKAKIKITPCDQQALTVILIGLILPEKPLKKLKPYRICQFVIQAANNPLDI
ncbi:MAG: hypothetical protein ONB51_13310 [candidate division KSB1 bacterium]|nr:hypothetical protein [candidate division KSB1 bacterium]MDZ7410197.1 hypothetical protein [candidate division KSB1 bacterium]